MRGACRGWGLMCLHPGVVLWKQPFFPLSVASHPGQKMFSGRPAVCRFSTGLSPHKCHPVSTSVPLYSRDSSHSAPPSQDWSVVCLSVKM